MIDEEKLSVEGQVASKIYSITIPEDGEYYLGAWVNGFNTSKGIENYSVKVDDQKVTNGKINIAKTSWQGALFTDEKNNLKTLNLKAGKHIIAFSCNIPSVPNIEFIRLSKQKDKIKISDKRYVEYIEELKNNKIPEEYLSRGVDTSSVLALEKVLPNPLGDYLHELDLSFSYTYYNTFYFYAGANVTFETKKSNPCASNPVMHLFNITDPVNKGSWGDDNSGDCSQAKITCTISHTGFYYLLVRGYWPNTSQTTDLYLYNNLYASNIPITCTARRCDHTITEELNYFTSFLTGDSRVWVESYETGLNGRILGYNDDYVGNGDFVWGTNGRVKKAFSQRIWNVWVTSYSSYNPTGTCDLYTRVKNSTIMSYFPNLEDDDAMMAANTNNNNYNCISWTGGRVDQGRYFWPPDAGNPWHDEDGDLASFDNYYKNRDDYGNIACRGNSKNDQSVEGKAMNFTRTNANANNACVALWANSTGFQHGSVKKPANDHPHGYDWESKPGGLMRTFHPRDALSGSSYGNITNYYRWDGTYTYGTPISKVNEDFNEIVTIIQSNLTNEEKNTIRNFKNLINEDIKKVFTQKFERWLETWNEPNLQVFSNPRMFAKSSVYAEFISFCKNIGKASWILIFDRYEDGDSPIINAIEDLTFSNYPTLMKEVRDKNNDKASRNSQIPSQKANWTDYIKEILTKLNSSDMYGSINNDLENNNLNSSISEKVILEQNNPNPFNMSTIIRFSLPKEGNVTLKIYNLLGQEIAVLLNNNSKSAGKHTVEWNGLNSSGTVVSTGIYIYKLDVNNQSYIKKLIVVK